MTPPAKSRPPGWGPHSVLFLLAALLGLLGVAGHLLGRPRLAGLGSGTSYMAPLSACLILLLSAGLLSAALRTRSGGRPWFGIGAALAAAALGLAALIQGQTRPVEAFLGLGGVSLRHMSLLTATSTLGTALAMLFRAAGPRRASRQAAAFLALLPIGITLVTLVTLLAGAGDLYPQNLSPMSLPSALAFLAMGAGILVTAGPDTWPAALFRKAPAGIPRGRVRPFRNVHVGIFLGCGAGVLLAGSLVLHQRTVLAHRETQAGLEAVARSKSEAIRAWYQNRNRDALEIRRVANALKLAEALRSPGTDLQAILDTLRVGAFRRVVLVDRDGRVRAAAPAGEAFRPSSRQLEGLARALRTCTVVGQDLRREPASGEILLDWWIPIGAPCLGALLVQADPEQFLYPILRWPVASATAEILLVRRDGDAVTILNDLRNRPGTALTLAFPLAGAEGLPAARAATGSGGIVRGRDYRGVPVMAALAQIPGTPWSLVAKIDEAEILGPLRATLWISGTLLTGAVLGMALLAGLLVRHREARQFRALLDLERDRRSLADRYAHLMDQASDVILVTDLEGIILEANQAAAAMYGRPLRGIHLRELRAPEAGGGFTAQFRQVQAGAPMRRESVHLGGDGARIPVEFSARQVLFGESPAILIFIRDISEQKAHEAEQRRTLRVQAALYRIAVATLEAPSLQDLFQRIHAILAELMPARNFYIATRDEGTGLISFPYFVDEVDPAPAPRPPARTLTDLVLATGEAQLLTPGKLAALTEAGTVQVQGTRPLDWLGVPLVIQGTTFGAMVVQSYAEEVRYTEEDVEFLQFAATQVAAGVRRKQAEAALRDSEEKFSKIFNSAPILAALSRVSDGWLLEVNDLYCRTLGYAREELLGHTTTGLGIISPADRVRLLQFPTGRGLAQNIEFTMVTKTGQPIPCLFSGEVVDVRGEALLISMVADITSVKQSERERQLLQSEIEHMQKLESLGRLAGGIAHDMNNVLAAIYAVTQAIRFRNAGTDLDRDLATVERAATRGRDLIKGLMGFTRKDLAAPAPVDLNDLVREEMALLERTLMQKYRLVMDLEEPLPPVMGETGTLGSALMNLCVNAVDAMPGGGTLTLRTRRLAEGTVQVAVEDTGEGMPPEILQKAMEPFFTTKPQGKGTGLGLAMVFSTARAHGGALTLDSQVGQGTQARMTLPCRAPGTAGSAQTNDRATPASGRNILLVDDDELLRAAVPGLLGALGHRVETVDGGRAALARLAQGATPDLVILDLNMPGMTGLETLRHIRARAPELQVLLATGFLEPAAQAVLEADPHTSAISKPFSMEEIREKI